MSKLKWVDVFPEIGRVVKLGMFVKQRVKARRQKKKNKNTEIDMNNLDGAKTYIGIAILVLGPLAAKYGVDSPTLEVALQGLAAAIGGALGVYGRWDAHRKAQAAVAAAKAE